MTLTEEEKIRLGLDYVDLNFARSPLASSLIQRYTAAREAFVNENTDDAKARLNRNRELMLPKAMGGIMAAMIGYVIASTTWRKRQS